METQIELRQTTELEKNVLTYLNDLRESGATNMYGATPYIVKKFKIPQETAISLLKLWMHNFNNEGNYDFVKK